MAGSGTPRDHSRYQQGVIRRAYEHKDTIALQRLGEIVSDLYVAEPSRAGRLWSSAATALAKLVDQDNERVRKVLANRDVEALATLVNDLNAPEKATGADDRSSATGSGSTPRQLPQPSSSPALSPSTAPRPSSPTASTPPSTGDAAPDPEQLKRALKAFRKRLKLTRLNEESKLGRSPLTSGKASSVVAIMPPRDYPPAVWEALVQQGKLRRAGGSFYELVE